MADKVRRIPLSDAMFSLIRAPAQGKKQAVLGSVTLLQSHGRCDRCSVCLLLCMTNQKGGVNDID